MLPNFLGMILLGLDSLGILRDALWIGNPQLGSDIGNNPNGYIHRIGEKGSQEPERSDLEDKPKAIVFSTALGNEQTIFVIQVKIAGQLRSAWFANIATIPLLLFLGEILDRPAVASPLLRFSPQPYSLCIKVLPSLLQRGAPGLRQMIRRERPETGARHVPLVSSPSQGREGSPFGTRTGRDQATRARATRRARTAMPAQSTARTRKPAI